MPNQDTLKATSAQEMAKIGESLRSTLYERQTDIFLSGEVGTGKTTFLQGFLRGMRVRGAALSPTFALEHRYEDATIPILHIDLYRLESKEAGELIEQSHDFDGIRCIEWSERLESPRSRHWIDIAVKELQDESRELRFTWNDMPLPAEKEIHSWRKDVLLPDGVIAHCNAVADLSQKLSKALQERGTLCRSDAASCAGKLHDLFRFLDFRPGASHSLEEPTDKEQTRWREWSVKMNRLPHERAASTFLRSKGFSALAAIVETHGLEHSPGPDGTTEQKVLFYADKRVLADKIVSVEERFDDFSKRYANGSDTPKGKEWFSKTKAIEEILFPGGPPF